MASNVSESIFYHVTSFSRHNPPLVVGKVMQVGNEPNDFWRRMELQPDFVDPWVLKRELAMETIRSNVCSNAVSRRRCLWVCETKEFAEERLKTLRASDSVTCQLQCTGRIHRADAGLVPVRSDTLPEAERKMREYWRGVSLGSLGSEILFEGTATVVGLHNG